MTHRAKRCPEPVEGSRCSPFPNLV